MEAQHCIEKILSGPGAPSHFRSVLCINLHYYFSLRVHAWERAVVDGPPLLPPMCAAQHHSHPRRLWSGPFAASARRRLVSVVAALSRLATGNMRIKHRRGAPGWIL